MDTHLQAGMSLAAHATIDSRTRNCFKYELEKSCISLGMFMNVHSFAPELLELLDVI